MSFDDKYLKEYVNIFVDTSSKEEMYKMLPNSNLSNYREFIMAMLTQLCSDREMIWKMMQDDALDMEEYHYLEEELNKNDKHITFLDEVLNPKKEEIPSVKDIIFLKTADDGVSYFEKDLKGIPREYIPKLTELYNKLKYGYQTNSSVNMRPLIGNNKLSGLWEIKDFKLRLIYRVLSDNLILIVGAYMKKDDMMTRDIKEILENRNALVLNELKDFDNPIVKEIMLREGEKIEESLYGEGHGKKR